MVNLLPAVLIGGPPHAGKSVLFYSVTQALRERGVRHHAIRACPDGEGNWSQESDPETVSQVRLPIRGEWPQAFVQRICLDLERRCLPFLVDMGAYPRESQACILQQCTHSVLLLRADKEEYTRLWRSLVVEHDLLPLAQIYSEREGMSVVTSQSPLLEGTITGLKRYDTTTAKGPLFDALVERIAGLFNSYSPHDLEKVFFEQAPTELVLDLYSSLQAFAPSSTRWEPEMLALFLDSLPSHTPLSVYGAGPNWLYAALSAYTDPSPFYQFDPRLPFGWIQPFPLQISTKQSPGMLVKTVVYQDVTVLSITIESKHLEYFQQEPLPFPPVPADAGLIIDGSIPYWLLTALVRLYKEAGVAWVAPYYVPKNKAVVAYSRVETKKSGNYVAMPIQGDILSEE